MACSILENATCVCKLHTCKHACVRGVQTTEAIFCFRSLHVTHDESLPGVPNNPANLRWSKGDMTTITENPSPNAQQLHERSVEPTSSIRQRLQHMRRRIRRAVVPSTPTVEQGVSASEAANTRTLPSSHAATTPHRDGHAPGNHRGASEPIHTHVHCSVRHVRTT